jgi:hypothetical protein
MAFSLKENPFEDLPKPVIIGGIAVTAGGVVIYLYERKKKTGSYFGSSSSSTATPSPTSIDPVTGLPYSEDNSTDPATGLTYLGEAAQYGSVAAAEASVSDYGTSGVSGEEGDGATSVAPGAVSSPTYTSNPAWATAVQAGLSDVSGGTTYDGTDIGTAIGDYLQGQPLTPAQVSVVSTAIAEFGPAPSPPPGGIIRAPATAPGVTQIAVPKVDGLSVEEAQPLITQIGLKSAISPSTSPKGVTRIITSATPAVGTKVNPGSTVTLHWTQQKKG